MKLQVNFKVVNSEYDQDYADQYNWGEEGPGNPKYLKTEKFEIDNIVQYHFDQDSSAEICCTRPDDSKEMFLVKNVSILTAELENGELEQFIVSNSAIRNTHATGKNDKNYRFYFYLLANPEGDYGVVDFTAYLRIDQLPNTFHNQEWSSIAMRYKRKSERIQFGGVM